jgi:5-methylcytosine-specific restriction endonuclease McrA
VPLLDRINGILHVALSESLVVMRAMLSSHSGTRSARSTRSTARSTTRSPRVSTRQNKNYCAAYTRDGGGKIKRDREATRAFQKSHPCPATGRTSGECPGYVIDHVVPLKRGGADSSSNMQWQTKAEAKAKDKVE